MRFLDVLALTSKMTMQRMLERDDFAKRLKAQTPIYLHECLYPLMQGQDSVEIRADVELGGSEQLFSLMVGRDLQRDQGQEPQICITLPILRGLDGHRRMGKSLGNYIGVGETAYDQFAKAMSIPDDLMREWFELLTDRPIDEINRLCSAQLTHPKETKETLGKDIVSFYYGPDAADKAAAEWRHRFSERKDPTDIPPRSIPNNELVDGQLPAFKLLVLCGLAKSNNEARRHIQAGAMTIGEDRQKVTDPVANVTVTNGLIVRVGNRNVVQVKLA
jgi:tyrosyl-tRNA synthetase